MPSFTTVNRIPVPPADVFAYLVTLSNWPTFTGYGPLPGIVEASLPDGGAIGQGSRVRVRNTDGSVHHEVVTSFVHGERYCVRMELVPPASRLMDRIEEEVALSPVAVGTEIRRRFETFPRSVLTAPLVGIVTHVFLRRAVEQHDRAVAAALGA